MSPDQLREWKAQRKADAYVLARTASAAKRADAIARAVHLRETMTAVFAACEALS